MPYLKTQRSLPCQGVPKVRECLTQATPTSWRPHNQAGLPLPAPCPHAALTASFHCTNAHLSHIPTLSSLSSSALAIFFLIFWSSLITAFLTAFLSLFLKVTARVTLLKISLCFLSSSSQHLECQLLLLSPNFYSSFRGEQVVIPWSRSLCSPALITPSRLSPFVSMTTFCTSLWGTKWQGFFPLISSVPRILAWYTDDQ